MSISNLATASSFLKAKKIGKNTFSLSPDLHMSRLILDLLRHIIHVCLLSEKQLRLRENICVALPPSFYIFPCPRVRDCPQSRFWKGSILKLWMQYIAITYLGLRVIARVVDGEVGKVLRRWTGRWTRWRRMLWTQCEGNAGCRCWGTYTGILSWTRISKLTRRWARS